MQEVIILFAAYRALIARETAALAPTVSADAYEAALKARLEMLQQLLRDGWTIAQLERRPERREYQELRILLPNVEES